MLTTLSIPCEPGASWDSDARSMCLPGTRSGILDNVWKWITSKHEPDLSSSSSFTTPTTSTAIANPPRIFLLQSVAGAGKTAIANSVAQRCDSHGILTSSFFFSRTAGRSSPKLFFSTIACGLASRSRELAQAIRTAVINEPTITTAPVSRQFEKLILLPSKKYRSKSPLVIVIDALDEGNEDEMRVLLEILRDKVSQLPSVFRIFITSRTVAYVNGFLSGRDHVHEELLNPRNRDSMVDIRTYAHRELEEIMKSSRLTADILDLSNDFARRSEGLFIWVSTIVQYLRRLVNPYEKLRRFLKDDGHKSGSEEAKMDKLYADILETCNWEDDDFVVGYKLFVGTIIAAKRPLLLSAINALHRSSTYCAEKVLGCISSLLSNVSNMDQPVEILHLSLKDFLTSRANSSEYNRYYLDPITHSQTLAMLSFEYMDQELTPSIPSTGYLQSDDYRVPSALSGSISDALVYVVRFWIAHLKDCDSKDEVALTYIQNLISERAQTWFEVALIYGPFPDIITLREWISVSKPNAPEQPYHLSRKLDRESHASNSLQNT